MTQTTPIDEGFFYAQLEALRAELIREFETDRRQAGATRTLQDLNLFYKLIGVREGLLLAYDIAKGIPISLPDELRFPTPTLQERMADIEAREGGDSD